MDKDYQIQPLRYEEFTESLKVSRERKRDFKKVFNRDIENIPKYAIGPYFWFIPDNSNMMIFQTSENLHELTSYKKDE